MRLIAQSYGYIGWTQFWGAFFSYYVTVNDFGFHPALLNGKATMDIIEHHPHDVYNPNDPYFGNSNLAAAAITGTCPNVKRLDWISNEDAFVDLRMAGLKCTVENGAVIIR